VRVGAVPLILEVAPKEINIGTHVRWTWWPRPPTPEALWKCIRQDNGYQTHHAGRPRYSLYVGVHHPAGKILYTARRFLQNGMMSPRLCVDFQRFRTSRSACSRPFRDGNGLHHQTTDSLRWRDLFAQTVRSPDRTLVSAASWLQWAPVPLGFRKGYNDKFRFMMVRDDLLITQWLETSRHRFSRILSNASRTRAKLYCVRACWPVPSTTPFLLSHTPPVNSGFCTKRLIADVGACCLLNALRNCLCTYTKQVASYNVLTISTRSFTLYAILHSARCLLGCKLLTFPLPLVPPFTYLYMPMKRKASCMNVSNGMNNHVYGWWMVARDTSSWDSGYFRRAWEQDRAVNIQLKPQ